MSAHVDGTATPRVVVFLHGLMETDHGWRLGGRRSYGDVLRDEDGWTPVYVRYNTGLHISENGSQLDRMLDELAESWPVPIERMALVGHSMGGLVARSACCHASERDAAWVRHVRHTVSLGSPHLGAPLADIVHYADWALHKLPETRMFGAFLRRRSGGIRDLRRGSLVDEDWRDRDPHALRAQACREVPLLEGATHHFVSATVTRSAEHPVGRLIGDWLVLSSSASGVSKARTIGFDEDAGHAIGGATHFALLNHPEVGERLREWLRGRDRRELELAGDV
jgi:pimeloyl-ACP methyl ester carboxylesterase